MHVINLSERDVRKLNEAWNLESWREFVRAAPADWKTDGRLTSHIPVFVQISYGQDMELDVFGVDDYFKNACRWEGLRYVSFAIATHVRCVKVALPEAGHPYDIIISHAHSAHQVAYEVFPAADIQRQHDRIYRTKDAREEDLIADPLTEPMTDPDGYEVKFWSSEGDRIPRRRQADENFESNPNKICGILLNLDTVERLFTQSLEQPYFNREVYLSNDEVTKYPLAFLRNIGQLQARQPLPLLVPTLQEVNEVIALRENANDDDSDEDEEEPRVMDEEGNIIRAQRPALPAVFGVSVQMYNRMLHYVAPRANEHAAICGHVTAACGGHWASSPTDKARATKAQEKVSRTLPHQRLSAAALSGHASKDLRVEQVYVMDLDKVHPDHRNGGFVIVID
jgi:hypothetical protein